MEVERERLFGADLLLRDGAGGVDFALGDPANASGDLALADGNDNIAQALLMRLRVRKGELAPLGWPDYGSRLHELIGEANVVRTRALLMAYAQAAIEQDPRVAKVLDVRAVGVPGERDVVRIAADIQLITAPTPLNLVVDIPLEPR